MIAAPLVSIDRVTYRYHEAKQDALEKFTGTVFPGEDVAIVGAAASGKTTAAGVLCGELPALWGGTLSGAIAWHPRLSCADDFKEPDITRIGALLRAPRDSFAGFLDSVREELLFDLHGRNWSGRAASKRVGEIADALGIASILERNPFTLSGGERQRAGLALTAVANPLLVVLDDPDAHLDSVASATWRSALRSVLDADASIVFEARDAAHCDSARMIMVSRALSIDATQRTPQEELPEREFHTRDLVVECISAGYPGAESVVKDFSFRVTAGECVGLVGPNGVGKTTLLRGMAGIAPVFRGSIRLGGQTVSTLPAHERCRHLSLALQEPREQFFSSSVRDELAFGLRVQRRHDVASTDRMVHSYAKALGIHAILDRHPRELSRSESRMVGIATTLLLGAPVLVLDEPTVGLDRDGRRTVSRLLEQHCSNGGCAIVASHDATWLADATDRLIYLPR